MNAEETLRAITEDDGNYLWQTSVNGEVRLTPKRFIPAPLGVEIAANKDEILALLRGVSAPALEHRLARGLDMLMDLEAREGTTEGFWRQLGNFKKMLNEYNNMEEGTGQ